MREILNWQPARLRASRDVTPDIRLFEMEPSPELEAVQGEYLRLAATLWAGTEPLAPAHMKDRDIFDLLGFH